MTIQDILKDETVNEIAQKHNKTVAQVLLRFVVQKGIATIPKSVNPVRIRENINIFDFSLDDNDITKLEGLDKGNAVRIFDFKVFKG